MAQNDTYIFTTSEGYLAWVTVSSNKAVCYIPQLGDWYESEHDVAEDVEGVETARMCLEQDAVQIRGEGQRMKLRPGQYHPRVWRGVLDFSFLSDFYDPLEPFNIYGRICNQSLVAAESLMLEVKEIFRFIEPVQINSNCYGHRLRELLILLCTEVETCWAGVLKANEMEGSDSDRWSTKNYIKVCAPLRLTEWVVRLKDYDLEYQPFQDWDVNQPTKSLRWYSAYNSVKHNREGNFALSTLGYVLEAAAALHVLQIAQFGPGVYDAWRGNRFSIFDVVTAPVVDLSEIYLSNPIVKGVFDSPLTLGTCLS